MQQINNFFLDKSQAEVIFLNTYHNFSQKEKEGG